MHCSRSFSYCKLGPAYIIVTGPVTYIRTQFPEFIFIRDGILPIPLKFCQHLVHCDSFIHSLVPSLLFILFNPFYRNCTSLHLAQRKKMLKLFKHYVFWGILNHFKQNINISQNIYMMIVP